MRKIFLFLLFFFINYNAFAGMQDISSATGGWTHSDAGNTVTETQYRIRSENTPTLAASTYHYKVITVSGNFTHYLTFGFDKPAGEWGIWAVSDTVGDIETLMANTSAHAIVVYLYDTGSLCKLYIGERDGSGYLNRASYITLDEAYRYRPLYAKIDRNSTTFSVTIYREPALQNVLYTLTKTLNSIQTYTYLFMGMNGNTTSLTNLYESYTGQHVDLQAIYGTLKVGQTFTPSVSHRVNTITIWSSITGTPGDITLSLYATDGNGFPTGSALATSTQSANGWSNAEHIFTLDVPVSLVAYTKYAWVLTGGVDVNNCIYSQGASSNQYAGGNDIAWNGEWRNVDFDCYFIEMGNYQNAFSGQLYLNENPVAVFNEVISTPLIYAENYDGFSGFPNSHITWTVGNRYPTQVFTSSDTFTPPISGNVEVLVVAAGGGGGSFYGGGGGAGGLVYNSSYAVTAGVGITVTIGGGGAGTCAGSPGANGTSGNNSVFGDITALGGGGGGYSTGVGVNGGSGGGGGGNGSGHAGGTGLACTSCGGGTGYGTNGGTSTTLAGGGGGAGGTGGAATGGIGKDYSASFGSSSPVPNSGLFAGGGGGWNNGTASYGGGAFGVSATANTGGGGGACNTAAIGNGGSGVVIIRYLQTTTITEDGSWSSDGDGKSVKITGTDGIGDSGDYFTPLSTTYGGGVVTADVKISALGSGAKSQIMALWDTTSSGYGGIAFVENVSGTLYFRVAKVENGVYVWGTATRITCALNTVYNMALIHVPKMSVGGPTGSRYQLIVNGRVADYQSSTTTWRTINRVMIGYVGGGTSYMGGTRYIDNLKYMNGTSLYATIARGGSNNKTLVATFRQTTYQSTSGVARYFYSTDNGTTWTYFYTHSLGDTTVRWCASRQSWYFFVDNYNSNYFHTKVYECTNLASPTMTLIVDYDNISNYFAPFPSRMLDSNGNLYLGMAYQGVTTAENYLKSSRFHWADGTLTNEHKFANYGDIPSAPWVDEPMLWRLSDGRLAASIRCDSEHTYFRYRISSDDGVTDWYTNTLNDPGQDWDYRCAEMRAFVFKGDTYWQGRDNQPDSSNIDNWATFIMKTTMNPINATTDPPPNPIIPLQSEMWWEGLGEAGNGDIDADEIVYGNLYLDLTTSLYGIAWYKRLFTGDIAISPRHGFTNFQDLGIN